MTTESRFSSRFTTLMAMAGLAIGLGNVWRFPYMMGQNGGSAFLLIYVLFMLVFAVPALSAEWSLGRATRSGPVVAFQTAFGKTPGMVIGLTLLSASFMAVVYYSVMVGYVMFSAWFAARAGFTGQTLDAYHAGLDENGLQYLVALGVMLACLWVVHRGLRGGIEAANKYLVPLFGVGAIYLVFVTLNIEGAVDEMLEFLKPDFSKVGPSVWFAAIGQAAFSVGLSGTMCVMYGSYLRDDARIVPTATATCMTDLSAALLASLFVVPAVLAFKLDMASGPSLLFNTLPLLFAEMPGGRWLAPMFLAGWGLVSMLSIIAAMDAIISSMAELTGRRFRRRHWLFTIGTLACLVMFPVAMNPHWIGTLDMIVGNGLFTLGAMLAIIAIGWGLGSTMLRTQIGPGLPGGMQPWMSWWIRWVMPPVIAVILGGFLYSKIMGA